MVGILHIDGRHDYNTAIAPNAIGERAKLPVQAISGTASVMDSASRIMKGLAAAGQAVVDEAVKAAESSQQTGQKVEKSK